MKILYIITVFVIAQFDFLVHFKEVNTSDYEKVYTSHVWSQPQQSIEDFYKKQCGYCHTKDELIAPDFNKIKAKYLEVYKTKDAFIEAIVKFVKNPDKSKAIYRKNIDNYITMPKMPFNDADIKAVSEYIYNAQNL